MRLHRFYISSPITEETFDISNKELVHQWKNVFRYNVGSQVVLFDGSGTDYLCMISSLRNMGATVSVFRKNKTPEVTSRKNVWLCLAVIKRDNFEWALQKATELGVSNVVPIICEHSEKKKLNLERLKKIAIEASEQSGRGDIPVIHPICTISEIFESGVLPQEKIVFHLNGISFEQYKNATSAVSFAVFVGPEGGFTDKEISIFKSYNVPVVSLGSQILRAETAAIAVSSLLLL